MLIQQQCDLSKYSTFGIGGPARYLAEVRTIDEMYTAFSFAKKEGVEILPLGKGSNSLFDDRGFNGLVLINKIDHILIEGNRVTAGGGASFSRLGTKTSRNSLGGLEFAAGIPGSVGGAIYMNAGANGQEAKDTITSVTFLHLDETERVFTRDEMEFSYRTSPFQKMKGIILEATFTLAPYDEAAAKQKTAVEYRIETQPYKAKSVGCIFRNPREKSAGQLIEEAGLKGYRIGGAEVSPMHGNFIVNAGGATSEEVEKLITHIRETVRKKTGILLEDEVRRIPYQNEYN